MSKAYRNTASTLRSTPQSQPIPGRTDMRQNNAGGYTFTVDKWTQLMRFLIIGTEGGTYYVNEGKHTGLASDALIACIKEDADRVVALAVQVSDEGRALKNDPALFALAMVLTLGDNAAKQLVVEALPKVARIPTHLFHFIDYATASRGWGRALKRAVKGWYQHYWRAGKLPEFVTKYPSRDGWSHLDVLRLSRGLDLRMVGQREVYDWVNGADREYSEAFNVVRAIDEFTKPSSAAAHIREHRLPREVVPTPLLAHPVVWTALAEHMPMTALIRNLGNLSKHEVFGDRALLSSVTAKLTDQKALKAARIHPLQVLGAMKTYAQGGGMRGSNTWRVVPQIKDALDEAFTLSFGALTPTGKRFLIAIDVSGSMGFSAGGVFTAAEAAAGIALTVAKTESNYDIMGFAKEFRDLRISANDSLDSVLRKTRDNNFGSTDCALPMLWATEQGIGDIDVFLVITDDETWAGRTQPTQALAEYRRRFNPKARLMVLATTATEFTIADPTDPLQLDVAGFDGSVGNLIREFALL